MVRTKTQRMSVVGVFHNLHEAQAAVRDLKAAGFRDDEIGVMGPGEHGDVSHTTTESADGGTHAAEGAVAGAATGAGVGALWAVGIAAGVLPAIGPVVAGGILASILASAAGGAAAALGGRGSASRPSRKLKARRSDRTCTDAALAVPNSSSARVNSVTSEAGPRTSILRVASSNTNRLCINPSVWKSSCTPPGPRWRALSVAEVSGSLAEAC